MVSAVRICDLGRRLHLAGTINQYPWNKKSVSSFAVLDQMIQYFDNKTLFPDMQQIVVGGHSAGGQTTQRYVMVGNQLKTKSPVHYYVANPNSYGWFSAGEFWLLVLVLVGLVPFCC
jgi:hypothetical protein